jgi:hypothetical protein
LTGRPVASGVSALSGCVANVHQAVHHVSSPPSKIPYGGFSPVRLQTGLRPQPSPPAHTGGLYAALARVDPRRPGCPSVWAKGRGSASHPVQRPLARRRVILSRQVMAYYGLIRGSDSLPPVFLHAGIWWVFALGPGTRASLLLSACPSCRAAFLTPADRVVGDCSMSTRVSLRPVGTGSASARLHAEVGSRAVLLSRLQSSLYAAARQVARPTPTRAFTPELSPPAVARGDVGYNYAGKQSIPAAGLTPAGHTALQAALQHPTSNRQLPSAEGRIGSSGTWTLDVEC